MKHFRNIFLWSPENHNLTYITIATKWIRKPQWAVHGQWKIRSRGVHCAKQWSGYRRQCVRPKQWIKDHMCALQIQTGCIGWSLWCAALSYQLQCLVGVIGRSHCGVSETGLACNFNWFPPENSAVFRLDILQLYYTRVLWYFGICGHKEGRNT